MLSLVFWEWITNWRYVDNVFKNLYFGHQRAKRIFNYNAAYKALNSFSVLQKEILVYNLLIHI